MNVRNIRTTVALFTAGAILAGPVYARQAPERGALIVLSKGDLTMAVVNPRTLAVIGRAPTGPDPHEVAVSSDGRTAFISNYNGGGNIISRVDLTTMKAGTPIDLGPLRAPHGLVFSGGKLWFTAEGAKVIGTYDPATSKVDWVIGTGQNRTHMIWVSADQQRIVTSNVSSGTVTIAERQAPGGGGPGGPRRGGPGPAQGPGGLAAGPRGGAPQGPPPGGGRGGPGGMGQPDWNETVIPVGAGAEGFDVTPDRKEIWTGNAEDGTVSVIDVASKRVVATLAVDVGGANRLRFTTDGKRALVSTLSGGNLTVIDTGTRAVVKRIAIGHGAAGIALEPNGRRAFVACTPDDDVVVVDLATLTVAGHISAGAQPDGLTWTTMSPLE